METCFICLSAVVDEEAKKRRVKLSGKGGSTAVTALESIFSTGINNLRQDVDALDAFLCYNCNAKLAKYAKLLKNLREIETEIKRSCERLLNVPCYRFYTCFLILTGHLDIVEGVCYHILKMSSHHQSCKRYNSLKVPLHLGLTLTTCTALMLMSRYIIYVHIL